MNSYCQANQYLLELDIFSHLKSVIVGEIGEGLWMQYASYMTLTVDSYYSALLPDKYDAFLALPYEERTDVKLFDLVSENTDVIRTYVRAFCFYFVEDVVYRLREKRFEILERTRTKKLVKLSHRLSELSIEKSLMMYYIF